MGRRIWLKLIVAALVIAIVVWVWHVAEVKAQIQDFVLHYDSRGIAGVVYYVLVYIMLSCIGMPRTPLNIGAGILFSYPIALGVVLTSAMVTFLATFQIARHLAQDWVRRKLERIPNGKELIEIVEENGFKAVFLMRLNPFVPAVLKGYGFGTTDIPLHTYLVASFLGFLPIACAHVYLGWAGGQAMLYAEQQPSAWRLTMIIAGIVISIALVAVIAWVGHRAVQRKMRPTVADDDAVMHQS